MMVTIVLSFSNWAISHDMPFSQQVVQTATQQLTQAVTQQVPKEVTVS